MLSQEPKTEQFVRLQHPFDEYSVTSLGRVYTHKRSMFLKQGVDRNGYAYIRLYDKKGIPTQKNLGRLVGEVFLPVHSESLNTLLYKDHDRTNCDPNNLRWVTRTYANRYHEQLKDYEEFNTNDMRVRRGIVGDLYLPSPVGTIAEAAVEYGLLYTEIAISARENSFCATKPNIYYVWEN